jgi:hypothetical protein
LSEETSKEFDLRGAITDLREQIDRYAKNTTPLGETLGLIRADISRLETRVEDLHTDLKLIHRKLDARISEVALDHEERLGRLESRT